MFLFRAENIEQIVFDLERKGVQFYGVPMIKAEGSSLYTTLRGPDGDWVQLSERFK